MKKRKELDALVSTGKIGSSKRLTCVKKGSGSCSAHELLRHDTDSSDMEDFSILQPRRKSRKKHGGRFCVTSVCLSLCQFILVTTSCLVSGALIWLHIGLREDLDVLRTHLQKVEAGNRNTPEALHVIHSSLKQLDSNVSVLYFDLKKNIADVENMTGEVKQLKDTASSLKASIASAPAIQQLPKDMHSLSESVANFGSKMTALDSNVKELKDQQSNMQTTVQSLSGELDTIKTSLQDLSNSSDFQSKSSANSSGRDAKLQSTVQDTNQRVDYLQGQLSDTVKSFDKLNTTCSSHLNAYDDLTSKVDTIRDAIVLINNSTLSQNVRLLTLETYIQTNVTLQMEQLEADRTNSLRKVFTPDSEDYLNKTISDVVLQLISKHVFHNVPNGSSNTLQSLEQTHDVLVLLAALLRKFEQIPDAYILNNKNATELVEIMLKDAFNTTQFVKNPVLKAGGLPLSTSSTLSSKVSANGSLNYTAMPVFTQSTGNVELDDSQRQLEEALG